jgi:hypothetical protein
MSIKLITFIWMDSDIFTKPNIQVTQHTKKWSQQLRK